MRIWLVSPYHTGSHQAWAEGYASHSHHSISLLTMAGRFWKWRMQGGAIELAAQARQLLAKAPPPAIVLATDMLNVPAWLGLLRGALPAPTPVVLYMHENQLTYPWRPGEGRDLTYAMINWSSQLAADAVLFNSEYHCAAWFEELPRLLKHYPDYNHLSLVAQVRRRSRVLPVGIEVRAITEYADTIRAERRAALSPASAEPPLILWNQRWEHDKRPDRFFALLYALRERGVAFRLAVAGENFRQVPQEFEEARNRLADAIVHWGYAPSRDAYLHLLAQSDLVISTADHEFFGISVLEAIAAGAFPLLPARLSYPELLPPVCHRDCLYRDDAELEAKAATALLRDAPAPPDLARTVVERYDWPAVAAAYDDFLESFAAPRQEVPQR